MSREDEIRLKLEIPVNREAKGATVRDAVIAAIDQKLQSLPLEEFDQLGGEKSIIVFRTVRQGPGPHPPVPAPTGEK